MFSSDLRSNTASCFADDASIVKEVTNKRDYQNLQDDPDKVCVWVDESNDMDFNSNNFELLRCTVHNTQIDFQSSLEKIF